LFAEISLLSGYLISMWKNFVKDYLSFTKKDRVGVIVLVTLIFIVVLLPYIWPAKKLPQPDKQALDKIKLQTAQLNKMNDAPASAAETKDDEPAAYNYPAKKNYPLKKFEVFYFDPNTLNAEGWKRLGIREKTAATIQNYLAKGGKFKKPEDISKIYGLFKDDYERLLPYVKIASQPGVEKRYNEEKKEYSSSDKPVYPAKKMVPLKIIEINSADTAALIALPGIGSKLAARIINFRDKLGGFYAVKQVAETYGLPDSTYNKIQVFLQCNPSSVKQLNINTADANTLKQHPYIRWNLANAIVQYRAQHGNFKLVDDLQQLALITPEIFEKIKAYLAVQ
jgi:competence protein ComEA